VELDSVKSRPSERYQRQPDGPRGNANDSYERRTRYSQPFLPSLLGGSASAPVRISVPLEEHDATALVARREVVAVVIKLDCDGQSELSIAGACQLR